MKNLTRYDLDGCGDHECMCYAQMLEEANGEYVKFSDIAEFLPSASANSDNLAILLRKWAKWYISDQKNMPPFADTIDAVGSVAERQI